MLWISPPQKQKNSGHATNCDLIRKSEQAQASSLLKCKLWY